MTSTIDALPVDPIVERRELIQATARRSHARRQLVSRTMLALCLVAFAAASTILLWIVYLLISNGAHWWSIAFFTQNPSVPTFLHPNGIGGIANALVGSLVIDGIAIVLSVPLGIVAGLMLAEADNRFANAIRAVVEVMTGLPTILFGLFVYELLIIKFKLGFSGIAGSTALTLVMIPIVMKGAEVAFRSVPGTLREAGLSLGLSRSAVTRRIVTPSATPGLLTGVLLSISRAVGETAPLLFVIGATYVVQWSPTKEQTAMPLLIFKDWFDGITPAEQGEVWGIGLILVVVVLCLNLASRLLAAYLQRERH